MREVQLTAVRYARIRVDWKLTSREGRQEMDADRRNAHDAFIDSCNILSRAMAKKGESTRWREQLSHDRRILGDFWCYLHCLLGLAVR